MGINAFLLIALAWANEGAKYLIVSAPRFSKVDYMRIPGDKTFMPLIDSGLRSPQGLAVDSRKKVLYVADPDMRKIFAYDLVFSNGLLMTDSKGPKVAAQNVEARWVAVDGVGNLFFTDELTNVVQKVTAEQLDAGNPSPSIIYDGALVSEVNRPGGVAVDNFHVFWTNKAVGTQVGSVVKGVEEPDTASASAPATRIARNSNKVYGVCLSQNNVYYTDAQRFLYGVKKNGGAIATVSDRLLGPRGCSWDGDGTVYVADKTANAIFSFPSNMHMLAPAQLTKVSDFDDAFGVALVQASGAAALALLLGLL